MNAEHLCPVIVRAQNVRPDDLLVATRPFHRRRLTRPARVFPSPLVVVGVEADTRKTVLLTITPDGNRQAVIRIEAKSKVEVLRQNA